MIILLKRLALVAVATTGLLFIAGEMAAQPMTTSELLLPYFEVEIDPPNLTTVFAVGNHARSPVPVEIHLFSNWGVELLSVPVTLESQEVATFNLRDWLVSGALPHRQLSAAELAHLQAALCGQRSPQDDLYYSTEIRPDVAVGYLRIESTSPAAENTLWGDFFVVDPNEDFAKGEALVDIAPAVSCRQLCYDHSVRFAEGGVLDTATEVIVWTGRQLQPSASPYLPDALKVESVVDCYDEGGALIARESMSTLPVEVVKVAEMAIPEPFGWLELDTEIESFLAVRYSAEDRFSVLLRGWCLPELGGGPAIDIEKLTNGHDADAAPGPTLAVGDPVTWVYLVTNVGDVTLTGITVTDDQLGQILCPQQSLEPGESMSCSESGSALACQYRNIATAVGQPPEGPPVSDRDVSHYFGDQPAALSLEKATNGHDADSPPGPHIPAGTPITWSYVVTNTGQAPLADITVVDDQGVAVSCPGDSLAAGESMTCTAQGTATGCGYANLGTATGTPPCGPPVSDSDPSHYYGDQPASIDLEKLTNGVDADLPPGPSIPVGSPVTWSYVVTNTGQAPLTGIAVVDDQGVAVSCPATSLAAGASMTCTAQGTAVACQYANLATVTASPPCGADVGDSDPSHYWGDPRPAIDLEKLTNGVDADLPPGPTIPIGSPVTWSYVVTNTGASPLTGVAVTDDQGVAVSCPATSLAAGASMTCTATGTAVPCGYANLGTVSAAALCGVTVSDEDPSHYFSDPEPGVHLEKATNGHDADLPPGPFVSAGSQVTWTYVVTNTGASLLTNVVVTDDQGVMVVCPASSLLPGESMTCVASAVVGPESAAPECNCQYENLGTVTAAPLCGPAVSDSDPSHCWYYGPCE